MNKEEAIKILGYQLNMKDTDVYTPINYEAIQVVLAELEKKDKVINLMSEEIDKLSDEMQQYDENRTILECCKQNKMCETSGDIDCKQCIIQFFEKKVGE